MKKILLFFFLFVLTFNVIGQPVWQWQNPNPPMVNFQSISMIDTTEGWMAVGTNSLMHYSGGQWNLYSVPSSFNMVNPSSVLFLSHTTGWVGCQNGIFRFNGITWEKVLESCWGVNDMFFFNQNSGWAVRWGGRVSKITGLSATCDSVSPKPLNALYFPDSLHGWAVGDSGTILSYYGNVWYTWPVITTRNLRDVYFTDLSHGWAVGDSGTVLYFNGTNWQTQSSGVNFNLLTLDFTDPLHGFAAGFSDTIISFNGTSWSFYCASDGYVISLDMVTPSRGFAACYMGVILDIISNTAVSSYTAVNLTQNELDGMCFVDKDHGWVVGRSGTILKYLNGTWSSLPQITNANLFGVSFPDLEHGWAVGEGGTIVNYHNGNWSGQLSGTGNNLSSVNFVDSLNGWAVGQDGIVLHYHNNVWVQQESNTDSSLLSVSFTDTANGWAVGTDGTIIHYNNGVWQNYNNDRQAWLNSVYFLSPGDGWAVGDSGMIMHYNGTDWQVDTCMPYSSWTMFRSVNFVTPDNGWVLGMQSLYHYDGYSWTDYSYTLPTAYQFYSVVFPDEGNGWVSGGYGNILYCKNPSTVVTNVSDIPEPVINNEVFPNPCESECALKVKNPDSRKMNIKVYEVTGQEFPVRYTTGDINNEETSLVIDVSDLDPGLYFLSVETGNETMIKKIIRK